VSDFAPSAAASRAADPSTTIVTRKHPSGAEGAFLSLKEVAHRILEGRLDPRVRAWAIKQLHLANRPKSHQAKAQAVLEGLRKKALYTPDPTNAEFIQAARLTLCLDETTTLCFAGGDCDDLCVAFGSAAMSLGIPVQVVGQAFDGTNTPTHVICAIQTEGGNWLKVDPSSERWPVGQCSPASGEHWIDPFDEDDKTSGLAGGATTGDYVGVGAAPATFARHWYPVGVGGWHYVDTPVGVGQQPGFVHAAVTNTATWIEYGALGAAIGVAAYVVSQIVKQ
jgi:transglutaminase-like putative cysteine protease